MDVDDAPPRRSRSEDDYGSDIELDAELEGLLDRAESQAVAPVPSFEPTSDAIQVDAVGVTDIEDVVDAPQSPFELFRPRGRLSVSDLVGTVWCEVQYDYRLRSLPYLPVSQRPSEIVSKDGTKVAVDKVKVEGKERVLKRGQKIHKRLEREIHPQEIVVSSETKEDVWGLRFLNMFSALEALLSIGKCRELPVVGFIKGVMIMGVIDEIVREPLQEEKRTTRSTKVMDESQTSLTSFFHTTSPKRSPSTTQRTHKLFISDNKTRASGALPRDSDTLAGRLQLMLYKELLDAMLLACIPTPPETSASESAILPTETPFSWNTVFHHVDVDVDANFSEHFLHESRPVVIGNGLRYGVGEARTLRDLMASWTAYVKTMGLGQPAGASKQAAERNRGRTEDRLELVYRRAGPSKRQKRSKKREPDDLNDDAALEEQLIQQAINESLGNQQNTDDGVSAEPPRETIPEVRRIEDTGTEGRAEADDELAWALEAALEPSAEDPDVDENGAVVLRASQTEPPPSPAPSTPSPPSSRSSTPPSTSTNGPRTTATNNPAPASGTILGKTVFSHSPRSLATHLASVLQWWMGERDAVGVSLQDTRRCEWCEFEENCEWRAKKAAEAMTKSRQHSTNDTA